MLKTSYFVQKENDGEEGLVGGHAYTITGATVVNSELRLDNLSYTCYINNDIETRNIN